ncbi:MAG: sensor histidine kinase [Acidimicrobiales bacterium]
MPNGVADVALVVVVGSIAVVATLRQDVTSPLHDPTAFDASLAFATAVPLAFRRGFPTSAVVVTCVLAWTLVASGAPEGAVPFVLFGVLFHAGSSEPLRRSLWALAAAAATLAGLVLVDAPGLSPSQAALFGAVYGLVWMTGVNARGRRLAGELASRRAAELDALHARRALAEQRLEIARELHDVVAHSMSVIAVQTGVALHFLDDDPTQTREALMAVSATSRSTLDELRQIVGVLRDDHGQAFAVPSPSLVDVAALVDRVHALGVPAHLQIDDPVPSVAEVVGVTVFRLVQEALTNTMTHAGPVTDVSIDIHRRSDLLVVAITDDGTGPTEPVIDARPSGHGLSGMRERVDRSGGTMTAGLLDPTGYSVTATFPIGAG